jgi:hypothetical protein
LAVLPSVMFADSPHTVMIVFEVDMFQDFKPVLDELGYHNGQVFFLHNVEKNQKGVNQFIPSVTMVYISFFPKSQGQAPVVTLNLAKNPLFRHNAIGFRNLRKERLKLLDGTTANPTQKSVDAFAVLIRAVVNPGSSVLVPCGGSGSFLVAAVKAGCNVFGIEADKDQFDAATARFLEVQRDLDELLAKPINISLCSGSCHVDSDIMIGSGPEANQTSLLAHLSPLSEEDEDDDDAMEEKGSKQAKSKTRKRSALSKGGRPTVCQKTGSTSSSSACTCNFCGGVAPGGASSPSKKAGPAAASRTSPRKKAKVDKVVEVPK